MRELTDEGWDLVDEAGFIKTAARVPGQ